MSRRKFFARAALSPVARPALICAVGASLLFAEQMCAAAGDEILRALRPVTDATLGLAAADDWVLAETLRMRADLLMLVGDHVVAETSYRDAIAVARRQNAKLFELRAATSLAYLWCNQGKRTEARDLLAPVYGWFTEGFDTLDLREAKKLLDELTV